MQIDVELQEGGPAPEAAALRVATATLLGGARRMVAEGLLVLAAAGNLPDELGAVPPPQRR